MKLHNLDLVHQMFSLNDILMSYTLWFVLIFAIYIAIHHILFFVFKYKGPKQGERLFFNEDQRRFRINYQSVEAKSPLVIFESHIGMPLEIWSYQETQLTGVISTLSYDRIGYGWSSLYLLEKREIKEIVQDLIRVLLAIPVIDYDQHGKLIAKRPLILVIIIISNARLGILLEA